MPSDEMNMGKAESRSNAKETLGAAIEPYFALSLGHMIKQC